MLGTMPKPLSKSVLFAIRSLGFMKEKHSVSSYFVKALLVRFLDQPQRVAELLQAAGFREGSVEELGNGWRPGSWHSSGWR